MARVKPEDVQLWTAVIQAAIPAGFSLVELSVQGVAAVVRAIRRMRGEPDTTDDQDDAEILAAAVIQQLEDAKAPWLRVRQKSATELAKLGPSE
jgi:ABC-type uncharacterized transport system substrate-binding protein